MKYSFHRPLQLPITASLWALCSFCAAQTPSSAPISTTTTIETTQTDLNAAGTVSSFDSRGLTVTDVLGSMTVYQTNVNTQFIDKHSHLMSGDSLIPDLPVIVHYTAVGNKLLATKVVQTGALVERGTLRQITPNNFVIELPGGPSTPIQYAYTSTTHFVDQKGGAVPLESVLPGATVRVFYTKVGPVLVASKVEALGTSNTGLSSQPIKTETTRTTTVTSPQPR